MDAAVVVWQVVLAAGASRRMGQSKAWLDLGGRSALERVVEAGLAGGCDGALVVIRPADAERAAALWGEGRKRVRWVVNPRPKAGRTGSLQAGIAALPAVDAFLLHPVDHPLVRAATVGRLVATWRRASASAGSAEAEGRALALLEPACGGRRGHPILLARSVGERICELHADAPLYTVVRDLRARGRARTLALSDSGILANLDCPGDWERWTAGGFPGGW